MNLQDFDYYLPEELIAQKAVEPRDSSKLFFYDKSKGEKKHLIFNKLLDLLDENYVLVFNKSRVIPARIKFDGKEILLSRPVDLNVVNDCNRSLLLDSSTSSEGQKKNPSINSGGQEVFWEAMVFPGRKFKEGKVFELNGVEIEVIAVKDDGLRILSFKSKKSDDFDFNSWLNEVGEVPLPPYIKEKADFARYQTTFSDIGKSVAAPTAGLHFTEDLLEKLKKKGVQIEFVHLDVGLGTFLPVKVDDIKSHKMHSESFSIDLSTSERLNNAKATGKKIIAVGTTSIRVLETVAGMNNGKLKEYIGDTEIFIYPGYEWKFIDEMITNFHLPKSTLLMLVSSFIGKDDLLELYKEAIEKKYRFYSFGDAMYLRR